MIGPHVVADMTRCIQCTRCIRFTQEIAGTSELTFLDRGGRTLVWTHDGAPLANDWSGCAADVCPVGALTVRDFRFRSRVWYLQKTQVRLPGLQRRLQRLDRVQGRRRLPLPAALEPGRQRLLALRLRAVPVRVAQRARRPQGDRSASGTDVRDAIVPGRDRAGRPRDPRRRSRTRAPPASSSSARRTSRTKRTSCCASSPTTSPAPTATSSSTSRGRARSSRRPSGSRATTRLRTSAARATWASRPGRTGSASTPCSRARPRPRSSSSRTPASPRSPTTPRRSPSCARPASSLVAARNGNALTRAADVVLPAASLAEKEGTFTNVQGRVQKFERAFLPEAPRARALGAPPDARDGARVRRPQLDARGPARRRSRPRSRATAPSRRRSSRAARC